MSEIAAITVSSEGDDADERTIITIKNARSTDANNIAVPEQAETKAAEKSGEEEPAPTLQSSAPSNAMRPVLQRKESFLSTGAVANSWHAGLRSSVTLKKLAAEPVTSAVYKLAVPVEEAEEEDDRYHSRRLPPVPKFPVSPRVSPKRLSLGGDGGLTTSPKKSSPERAAWRHTLRKGECPYEELSTQEAQRLVNEVQDQEEEVYADGDLNGINNHSPQKVKGRVEVDGESAHYMNPTEASIVKSRKLKQPKRINYVGPSESDVEHRLRVEKRREFMEKKRQAVEGAQIAQLEQDLKLARAETYHALREAQEAREIKISYQALAGEKAAQDSAFKLMHKRVDLLTKANKELSMKVAISRNRVKGPKRIDQLRAEHKKEIEYEREQTRKKCAVEYDKLKQKLNNVTMEKRGLLSRMNKLTARSNAIDERAEKVKTRETTLDDTVSALEEQLAATEEERKRLDVANDNLTHRNNSLQGQIDEMQDQINKLIIDGEDMERGKDAIRKLELQEAHKEELREEIKTAYTALQSVQSSNTRLTTQVERLQDELESAKLQLQLMESDKASRDSIASVLHKQQRDDLHDEIKSQAQKQQDKISLLNEKTDMLESNLEAEKAISKQYEDAMEAARKRRKDVESERDLLREQIEEKAEALSHLRQEYNALSQDFEDYKARAAEVEKERASVSAVPTLDAMAKEAEGGRTKDEGKEKEVKEAPLQSENTDDAHGNRKSVAGTAADTANLCDVSITVQMDEEEIQALQEQIQQLKLKHEDIMQSETNKYVNVKTELDELRADHSRLQAIRETEKSEYLEARSERDVLQEQFSEMKEAHESMLGKYEALRSEYDALSETHVQELSNTTSDDKRLRKEAESDLERARVQRGNLEQDLKDVRAENQRMTDDVVDLREQCEALQVQLAGKETETSMLQQERSEMKTKFIALTEKVDSLSSAQAAAQESVALKREQEQRERDLRREQEYQKQKEAQREQERELALQRERDQMKEDELKKEQNRLMERGVGQLRKEAELREQKLEAEIALLRQQAAQEEMKHQQTQYLQEQQQQHRILEQHQAQNVAAQSLYAARPIMDRDLQHGSPPSKRGLSHSLSLSPSHSFVHDGAGIGSGNNENLNYPGLRQHISVYLSNQPQSPQAIRAAINALRQEKIANRRSLSPVALQLISEIENVLRELVILGTKLNTRLQTIKSLPDTAAPAAASMSDRQTDKQLMAYSSVVQYKKKLSTQVSVLRNTYSSTQQKIAHSWHKLVVELRMDQANQLRQPTHASLHMHAVGSGAGAGMNASAHNIHNLSTATMSLASPASTHHHSHLTMNPPSSSSFAAVNEQAMRERARMKLRAELGAHITSSANHAAINTPTGGLGSSSMLAMLNESHARQALGSRPVPASVLSSSASSSFASPRAGTAQQESAYERYLRSSNPPFNLNTPTPTPTSASASASVTTPGFRAQRGSNPPLSLASADAANTAALRRLRNI